MAFVLLRQKHWRIRPLLWRRLAQHERNMAMMDRTVAQRYAEAFVDALQEGEGAKGLKSGLEEMKLVSETYDSYKQFRDFLGSPEIATEKKKELMDRLWDQLLNPKGKGLLDLLIRWDRIDHLPVIVEEAARLAEIRQGILRGEVVTARPISADEAEALSSAVGARLKKKVQLERVVDPALIGGVRIIIGTLVFDVSVQTQLQKIRQQLLETKVN